MLEIEFITMFAEGLGLFGCVRVSKCKLLQNLSSQRLFRAVINLSWFFPRICNSPPTHSPNCTKTSSHAPRPKLAPSCLSPAPAHEDTYSPNPLLGSLWVDISGYQACSSPTQLRPRTSCSLTMSQCLQLMQNEPGGGADARIPCKEVMQWK